MLPVVVSAGLGVALLGLAVPRTVAAWASLEARWPVDKLKLGEAPSDAELRQGVAGLKRALAWVPSGRRLTDLALLEIAQAHRLTAPDPARASLLAAAERHLVEGLAADPVDGFAWFRLAVVRAMQNAPARDVAAALAQSLDMAPNARRLWLPRAGMCLDYWHAFTFEELLALRAQLRTIWATDAALRQPLTKAALPYGRLAVLTWALGDDPPSEADVEKLKALVK